LDDDFVRDELRGRMDVEYRDIERENLDGEDSDD